MSPTPSLANIETQINHELGSVEAGKQRYRRLVAEADFPDTRPGLLALAEMLGSPLPVIRKGKDVTKGLIFAIDEVQTDMIKSREPAEGERTGRTPAWGWLITLLDAEKMALITARCMLSEKWHEDRSGRSAASICLSIASALRNEVEFEAWQAKSGEQEFDLARIMIQKTGQVDARTFQRWRKKLRGQIERLELDHPTRLQIGAVLLDLGVRYGAGWFEMKTVFKRGKTERRVFLTPAAFEAVSDINSRLEVSRPLRLPMICKPKQWRREDG